MVNWEKDRPHFLAFLVHLAQFLLVLLILTFMSSVLSWVFSALAKGTLSLFSLPWQLP